MSVNTMQIEDVYSVLNDLHEQTTGYASAIQAVDTSTFNSVAQAVLQTGTDCVYAALMNTITKTIFSSRPYSRQFGGIIADNLKWGGITRKITFGDTDAEADDAYVGLPADGSSVDPYVINRGEVVETRYYGTTVYQDHFTVFEDQLFNAFSGPDQLGDFISTKVQEVNNKWVQWTEDLARGMIINAIAANIINYGMYISLLSEYAADSGQTITIQDVYTSTYSKPFWEYVRAKIKSVSREFEQRSNLYQCPLASWPHIYRHTPARNQKIYMLAKYMDIMETTALAEVFHDDYLKYADVEKIAFWQEIYHPDSISLSKFVCLDGTTGTYTDITPVSQQIDGILGFMFDEDALLINIKDTIVRNSAFNPRGLYWNTYLHANVQYCTDFTEKMVAFVLD